MSARDVTKLEREIARLPREDRHELLQRLLRQLTRDDPIMRREKLVESARLVRQWASEPPDHDDAWWEEFERELREDRLTFREIALGEDDE